MFIDYLKLIDYLLLIHFSPVFFPVYSILIDLEGSCVFFKICKMIQIQKVRALLGVLISVNTQVQGCQTWGPWTKNWVTKWSNPAQGINFIRAKITVKLLIVTDVQVQYSAQCDLQYNNMTAPYFLFGLIWKKQSFVMKTYIITL